MSNSFTQPAKKTSTFKTIEQPVEQVKPRIIIHYGKRSDMEDFDFTKKEAKKPTGLTLTLGEERTESSAIFKVFDKIIRAFLIIFWMYCLIASLFANSVEQIFSENQPIYTMERLGSKVTGFTDKLWNRLVSYEIATDVKEQQLKIDKAYEEKLAAEMIKEKCHVDIYSYHGNDLDTDKKQEDFKKCVLSLPLQSREGDTK